MRHPNPCEPAVFCQAESVGKWKEEWQESGGDRRNNVTCCKSNTTARILHKIAIKEDTWPLMVIPWRRHTVENGHRVCAKQWKKSFCVVSWEPAVAWHLPRFCVYLLIAPQARFTRWECRRGRYGQKKQKNNPKNIMGNTSGQSQEKKSKLKPYQTSPKQ